MFWEQAKCPPTAVWIDDCGIFKQWHTMQPGKYLTDAHSKVHQSQEHTVNEKNRLQANTPIPFTQSWNLSSLELRDSVMMSGRERGVL